jgi:uncharacterized protein YxjI
MGEVIHVNFADTKYSTTVQGVLSKRIQAKLDQLFPDRWNRADRIAAQAIGDMRNFDQRIEFKVTLERPVDANGNFSEAAFLKATEKLKADVEAQLHEIRKAAHLSIAATAYSTVINVAAPEDMLGQVTPAS